MGEMDAVESEALWDEFHRLVNMTSQELSAWLETREAAESTEALPQGVGAEEGRRVLSILLKRRADLTDDDVQVMHQVVEAVEAQQERDGDATDTQWRHSLMTLGHDPLKP
ncbi:DUF3140 domain-containing protein [Streptomyces sp. NBC_01142]|uniref:DUF3140 domain-containing protein n=1 Tax=Streptomyces sp. NBC_01142 TaxID=2975865 RepID=UPI00224D4A5A|nr:DUF3140 domain-containing protein [Streptomyces sp. NBC_01142]MCX4821210.1 DUF3140 domain-containing protein [Streptomyces sp. NBC_01142]